MTETDPHLWPRPTAASLLAGLHATTDADAAESLRRGLRPTVEVWRVESAKTPLREFDTKREALAWSDHLVAIGEAPACWPVLVEVAS